MSVTPTQWKEFKEWREKEIERITEECEKRMRRKKGSIKNGVVYDFIPDVPPLTVEGCLDWLISKEK